MAGSWGDGGGAGERRVRAEFREGDDGNVTVKCGRYLELRSSS
jgi:hypothetical protein